MTTIVADGDGGGIGDGDAVALALDRVEQGGEWDGATGYEFHAARIAGESEARLAGSDRHSPGRSPCTGGSAVDG